MQNYLVYTSDFLYRAQTAVQVHSNFVGPGVEPFDRDVDSTLSGARLIKYFLPRPNGTALFTIPVLWDANSTVRLYHWMRSVHASFVSKTGCFELDLLQEHARTIAWIFNK